MSIYDYFLEFSRVPAVPIVGYPILRLLNLTTRKCLLEDPRAHAELIQKTCQILEMDACLPLLDLTVEAELLGALVEFPEYDAPRIVRRLDIDQVRKIDNLGRTLLMVEAIKRASTSCKKPLGSYVTGPFTTLCQVLGIEHVMLHLARRSERIFSTLDLITDICIKHARDLVEAGADFLIVAEPISSLLSRDLFEAFSKPYLEVLCKEVEADIILHICGRAGHLLRNIAELKITGVSIDQNIPLEEASAELPENMLIFGNYNPVNLLFKNPEEIKFDVLKMLEPVIHDKRVVASTGCDVPSTAPIENIKAFIQASKSMSRPD
jgi:uroporphyrinogen decarboxylase